MKSHDILGIKESATHDEIEYAYAVKRQVLDKSQGILPYAGYIRKLAELEQAKEDCVAWQHKPNLEQLGG